jgi:hypothetical protein
MKHFDRVAILNGSSAAGHPMLAPARLPAEGFKEQTLNPTQRALTQRYRLRLKNSTPNTTHSLVMVHQGCRRDGALLVYRKDMDIDGQKDRMRAFWKIHPRLLL